LAIKHVDEPYVLGARAPMANPKWKGPWDCAEFASWCLYQATGVLFGVMPRNNPVTADAFSGFWADQAREANAVVPIEVAARTVGAFVVRKPAVGKIGHIVISDGRGGTIEAHSSKRGVIRSTLAERRWDLGVIVPNVVAHSAPDLPPIEVTVRTLRVQTPLLAAPIVKEVQRALIKRGFAAGSVDGVYGPQTAHAVRLFQLDQDLVADGEVGPATFKALKIPVPEWAKKTKPL
ncbi:MAG TPA: peptidoglycan-binding domain-containing protein, partial [Steroidobacteraceae bacterium]|nr:peptidoglycan-binding domain-containing protein [Steroidobacteraceae bacterium]